MGEFLKIKFVFVFLFITHINIAQDKRVRVFEKKIDNDIISKNATNNLHLVVFPFGKQPFFILVDQNRSSEIDSVNLNEWQELPENTLIVVQPLEHENPKVIRKKSEPILLGSFTLNEFKQVVNKDIVNYAISWSMNTIYSADSSVQTSRKIEASNCCDKGTCSILVSVEKKSEQIHLISTPK